jgi:hypothetical protein
MEIRGFLLFWSVLTALIAALSLGPSFAHVLESVPRLTRWSPDLWRETTVFNAQFWMFAAVGAPLDILAIVCPAILTWRLRGDSPAFGYGLTATVLYLAALVTWALWVQPANSELATWQPGPIPSGFDAIRLRWETGHMAVAALKFCGFFSLVLALLSMRRA